MLENIAAQILNRYIGQYVENINTQNLSIGLLQGAVELENLPLKKDALNDLNLPGIVLKSGHIGKVVLRIASYKTIKEPWVIEIHRLSLVVGPGDPSQTSDKEAEGKKKEERKQNLLKSLEDKWGARHGQSTSLYSVWYSYSSSIITTIMENLQFEIHDLHIRYEDDKTLSQQYACGVCIENLTARSTDENWIPTSGGHTVQDMMFKLLQLDGFSVYWDVDAEMVGDLPVEEMEKKLRKWAQPKAKEEDTETTKEEESPSEKYSHFLLTPVCGEAKMTRNCSVLPLRSKNQPRISLDVKLDEISLHMGQTQYRQAISLMSELTRSEKRDLYKDGRPSQTVVENPCLWWKWAAENHLKQIRRSRQRLSKEFLLSRAKSNVQYITSYEKVINSKMELEKITGTEVAECVKKIQEIEKEMSFDEICVLREVVYEKADRTLTKKRAEKTKEQKQTKEIEKGKEKPSSWRLTNWLGWGGGWKAKTPEGESKPELSDSVDPVLEPSEEDLKHILDMGLHESVYKDLNEEELYEMFGEELVDQDTNDTFLKRDSVLLRLNFTLNAGTLSMYEDIPGHRDEKDASSLVPFVELIFQDVSAATEWRPRYKSSEMKMDLGGIFVRDLTSTGSCFSDVIKPQVQQQDSMPQSPRDANGVMSSSIKGIFQLLSPNKAPSYSEALQAGNKSPVFSLLFQNQPRTSSNQFTNRLEVVTAPLSITFLPNLMERVKGFFKSKESFENLSDLDDGISTAAREKYEAWKIQSQAEIKRTVRRIMDGKTTSNVSHDRWAVSLNISAPEIILPENISDPNSNIVIVNLGHMIFKNHNEDDHLLKWKKKQTENTKETKVDEQFPEDEDDFVTPPDTPPSEGSISESSVTGGSQTKEGVEKSKTEDKGFVYSEDLVESPSQQRLNEKLFYERMYEKYQIHFTDLQVLVAKPDDKWEATRSQGKGPHHLVEKFSVDILMERRIVPTFDPECPAVKVKGNLPHLTIHISHNKVHSLFNCLDRFTERPQTLDKSLIETFSPNKSDERSYTSSKRQSKALSEEANKSRNELDSTRRKSVDEKSKSKQLFCQFSLNEVSILLEESPTSILSVLDVYRIQMEFTKRPYDHCATFSIHSLLLCDTNQELGHDFELLLASHRNVKMDLGSGNILDSGTASPNEVRSSPPQHQETSTQPPGYTRSMLSSVARNLHKVTLGSEDFSSLSDNPLYERGVSPSPSQFESEEDLITVKWEYVANNLPLTDKYSPDGNSVQNVQKDTKAGAGKKASGFNKADVKFNSLDLVLNLKTWVALLDFLHHLKPQRNEKERSPPIPYHREHGGVPHDFIEAGHRTSQGEQVDFDDKVNTVESRVQSIDTVIYLEFHKLNVLLMRHIESEKVIGRKVATLTMHDANIHVTFDDKNVNTESENENGVSKDEGFHSLLNVSGSVGSLGLQDLTNAVRDNHGILRGMQVLSLGEVQESLEDSANSTENLVKNDSLDSVNGLEAFSFTMTKGRTKIQEADKNTKGKGQADDTEDMMFTMDTEEGCIAGFQDEVALDLHLASVLYMHTPRLLAEVLALVDEAGDIIGAQMTSDTRQAYKDMAYSIMDKSIAVLGKSVLQQTDVVDGTSPNKAISSENSSVPSLFKLTVDMQSPIVALPKCQGSFELLVGNLGRITVKNDHALGKFNPDQDALDVLHISITEMNVSSKRQVEEEKRVKKSPGITRKSNLTKNLSGPSLSKLKTSSSSKNSNFNEVQILHDTSIMLTVVKKPFEPSPRNTLDVRNPKKGEDGILMSDEVYDGPISDKKMCVDVQMLLPLTVTLSKPAYEQVLKTLDHISYGGNIDADDVEELDTSVYYVDAYSKDTTSMSDRSRSVLESVTSQQSTPSHSREFKLFSAPGLEITPGATPSTTSKASTITQRKYTPISADISIPKLVFQLNEDLSEGEQGVVKVTLEGFIAKFEKENRSTTQLDLTLGSVDVEDLLKDESSPHRHIVVSYSHTSRGLRPDGRSRVRSDYLSTSCPAFVSSSPAGPGLMSSSLPTHYENRAGPRTNHNAVQGKQGGRFRPFDSFNLSSGPFGTSQSTHKHQTHNRSRTVSNESSGNEFINFSTQEDEAEPSTPPCTPDETERETSIRDETLVRIRAFLVDGKAAAYDEIYDRTNRRIDIDFNSLDCKINLQTWVVLLDFFGIGTSPKKTYDLDPRTEEEYNWDRRLAVSSYYENQPDAHINSEIDFKVRSFSLIFNKEEYELVKANISKFETHVRIRDGTLGVAGQLGSLSVSDLSPNGERYRERFVFAGDKAMDFDIKKFDEYDYSLEREFDIRVKLRMSAICYVHTQRFQQELIAYLQHFQQLQEVLGRMRAASVGQTVRDASCRQARVLLDIEADSPVLLIPESSHSDRLIVVDLGHMTVKNSFKLNGDPGTLSQTEDIKYSKQENPYQSGPLSPGSRKCLLDVIHADLDQMDLFTAVRTNNSNSVKNKSFPDDKSVLVFTSFIVTRDGNPLLKEKCKLSLQIERNLEKETMVRNVPDTSVSGQLSSVYCTIDFQQYWLVRGMLDHNLGEPVPEFPQPTAFLQPSDIQTVLSGSVYTGMSVDMHLLNVSVELLQQHATAIKREVSLARLDYVKSRLSYRSFSDQTKTVNLSCEAFFASDTRWPESSEQKYNQNDPSRSVFKKVFGPTDHATKSKKGSHIKPSNLQFELQYRAGPDFMHFTALLVDMRVYLILDWLSDIYKYIIVNPAQEWCDSLRFRASDLLEKFRQVVPGQEQQEEDPDKRDVRFKINVTNTDFVLVENSSRHDSDAVILRCYAVLHHNPNLHHPGVKGSIEHRRIMNCTLQSLEVFSCQLDQENNTALSIVDPVTINVEVDTLRQCDLSPDEINFDPSLLDKNRLDIQIMELNTRVSYNDLVLFLAIAKSLPIRKNTNIEQETYKKPVESSSNFDAVFYPPEKDISHLEELGFSRKDVIDALKIEEGNVERAADWLLLNRNLLPESEIEKKSTQAAKEASKIPLNIGKVILHVDSACVCLIDDCAENCDVPLAELALRALVAEQNLSYQDPKMTGPIQTCYAGKANFSLNGDYYNRMLSVWEPYLEPWRCVLKWNLSPGPTLSSIGRWNLSGETSDRLDISVTSTLIETVKKTMDTWTSSFNRSSNDSPNLIDLGPSTRKRQPFVPYVLRNLTGLPLQFATHVSAIQKMMRSGHRRGTSSSFHTSNTDESFLLVQPGDSHPFHFKRAEKQRHKRSDQILLHQIVVKVGDWETLPPVTISKVGVYFRHATEEINKSSSVYRPPDPVRVVFAVTLEGSAQKIVTVRSGLVIRSKVKIPVQLQLVRDVVDNPIVMPLIEPGGVQYVPLHLTSCGIKIKPAFSSRASYKACSQTIHWNQMKKDSKSISDIVTCQSEKNYKEPFRFSVCIKKKMYPTYEEVAERLMTQHQHAPATSNEDQEELNMFGYIPPHMPGHTIIILPPVVVSNLLPCDLHYYFKDTDVAGKLSPGQDATLHGLHLVPGSNAHAPLILGCGLEGFKDCRELNINHMERNSQMRMCMVDHKDRSLILNVRVFWRLGCSVKISVMSGYWIVNKTGLPIIVKQEGARFSAAGQYNEHERARSLTPLLFSYSDRDLSYLCTMRLGREARQEVGNDLVSKYPHARSSTSYCQSFSIDGGTCTRNLTIVNHDNTPSRVYYIGVGVRRGWGRYRHTHIVTLAPRFLLVNLTKKHTLNFAQVHATSFTEDSSGLNRHLTIISGSSVVFHWPRSDLDMLLCTRLMDMEDCRWSGGFVVDRIDAFHVHLRVFEGSTGGNYSVFLRVEITLVEATYRVTFYDGGITSCPSPLRVDNISAAPLVLKQLDADEGLNIEVGPSSQVPYACDEPCLPPLIGCNVKGGSGSTFLNMDNIGEEKVLYYENFIYIVLGPKTSDSYSHSPVANEKPQKVLEVQQVNYDQSVDGTGHLVTLGIRRAGKRSQLWRMTSEGYLRHEGSSPPTSGKKYPHSTQQGMVLDIAELEMGRGDILPLTIRKIDLRRKSQQWRFTNDGRLSCGFRNLCVQISKSNNVGIDSFMEGGVATPNQLCRSEKMIAGSGVLSLKVVRDGPTRVIRVVDIKQKRAGLLKSRDASSNWTLVSKPSPSHSVDPQDLMNSDLETQKPFRMTLKMTMAKGVGVSLISNAPEELMYLTMSGVRLESSLDEKNQSVSLQIQRIQIDNQLFGGRPAVMLHPYKSPSSSSSNKSSSSSTDLQPALSIEAVKLPSTNSFYEIYHSLAITVGRMCLKLEEKLLLKLIQFIGSGFAPETDLSLLDETKMDLIQNATISKIMKESTFKRYYFDSLIVKVSPMQLSVLTASTSTLDPELKAIKQSSSLVLIQFERAPVVMQAYTRQHVFETTAFIVDEARKHFTDQLKGQAARILGSVDFLGNPIGLLSDLKAGVGSLARGNMPSLVKHITHGLSDSAAKVTGTLSAISGGITMDQHHEEKRRLIRANSTSNPGDHFVAGLHGLATGLVGGLTSIVTQTVRGATDEGAKGFFTGFGKGLVGTVTKPVTGVLDFASETASFVRDTSISSSMSVQKVRLPRSCHSFQGCLECYSESHARNLNFLHLINGRMYDEWLYSVIEIEQMRSENMLVLISNKRLFLTKKNDSEPDNIVLISDYGTLVNAKAFQHNNGWYLELAMKIVQGSLRYTASTGSLQGPLYPAASKKPRIVCHSEATAKRICEHVNYAKMLASEQSETLPALEDDTESDKAFDLEV